MVLLFIHKKNVKMKNIIKHITASLVMILFIMFNLYKMLYGGRAAVAGDPKNHSTTDLLRKLGPRRRR